MTPIPDDHHTLAHVDRRLALTFGALILALMLAVLLAGGLYLRGVMEEEDNKLSTTLTAVMANAVSHISFSGKYHTRLLLQEIQSQQPGIRYVLIADPDGHVLAHSNPALNDTPLDAESLRIAQNVLRHGGNHVRQRTVDGQPVREITLPYRGGYDNAIIGIIQAGLSEQSRDTALRNGIVYIATLTAVLLVIGVLVTLRISRHFGNPIKHLASDMAATLHAIPDLLFELDQNGLYRQVLAQDEELLAASRERLLGHTVREILPPEAAATVHQAMEEAAAKGASHGRQIWLPLPQGVCWFELSVARKEDAGKGPMRFIVLSRDITARKQAEEQLQRLNESLEQRVHDEVARNREKDLLLIQQSRLAAMGEMIHNIAHQWRQPLNALGLLLVNIKDSYAFGELTGEKLDESIGKGRHIVQKMSATIDDFRNFFRPNKEKSDFAISQCLREIRDILGATLSTQNIELADDIGNGIIIHGYENELSQVLLNIISNAKEAIAARHHEGGRITVRAMLNGGMAEIRITDNGGGIPQDILPKVFDPYFTTKDKGTGIGLYMSKMIVEGSMGGEISARNMDGGAEFVLRLPASPAPSSLQTP